MLFGLATGGLWRVLWYSLVLALFVGGFSAALRAFGVSWEKIRYALIGVYGAVYVWWFFANGIIIDRISVLWSFAIFLCVASVGRPAHEWLRTGRDLSFFVAMWIAYDESRGIADGTVRWYDVIASFVYYSHFILPPLVMAILWFRNRDQWVRYMRRFATVILLACTMFVLMPTAPPWMAAGGKNRSGYEFDALPPLRRPTGNGWRHIGLDGFVEAWDVGRDWANEVAAMPSLHSAYALFVVVFFWPRIKPIWVRWALLSYPITMAVALMYFGEHYLADALGGWAIVGISFLVWNRIERRLAQRRAADDETNADSEAGALDDSDGDEPALPSATVGN